MLLDGGDRRRKFFNQGVIRELDCSAVLRGYYTVHTACMKISLIAAQNVINEVAYDNGRPLDVVVPTPAPPTSAFVHEQQNKLAPRNVSAMGLMSTAPPLGEQAGNRCNLTRDAAIDYFYNRLINRLFSSTR